MTQASATQQRREQVVDKNAKRMKRIAFTVVAGKTCFPCHAPAKNRDFVFTRYAR